MQIVEDLEERFTEDSMMAIIRLVASSVAEEAVNPPPEISGSQSQVVLDEQSEKQGGVSEADWGVYSEDLEAELVDGPRYGEYEDDLADGGDDDCGGEVGGR